MGTVVNGNIWSGACVAGKEITGLVKNGVVFYKREIPTPSVYKRRIMVGDNLKGLQIFLEQYPDDFYDILFESDGEGTTIIVECNNGDSYIEIYNEATYDNSTDELVLVSGEIRNWLLWGGATNIYDFDLTTDPIEVTVNSPKQVHDNMDYIVTNIDNTSAGYRCLFIEDSNIRPLQVGDKIINGTKFYGVVPDDYNANNINSTIQDNNNNTVGYFSFYENTAELWIKASSQTSIDYIFQKNPYYSINNSRIISQTEYTVGSITNETNPNFAYLLVDTTTLGE